MRGWARPGWLAEIGEAVVSVFFPSGCRGVLTIASRVPICEECLSSFERIPNIVCEVCGRPLPGLPQKEGNHCFAWLAGTEPARARSFCRVGRRVVRAILLLKFAQTEPLGAWFAERLAELLSAEGDTLAADVVVPVPRHRERERERGVQPGGVNAPGTRRKGSDCRIERCC